MASSVIGSLRVNLGLDSAQFAKGANTANATLKNMQKQFVAVAGVAAAVGGALTTLTIATSKTAVSIKNLSQVSSALPGEFQKWAVAAKTVGIEQEKLGDILKDVNDRVGDFLTTGGGPMADFFENVAPKIGITADAFRDLSGPQALQLYVDSLQKAGLSQQEMTFYLEAMASDTTALIPLLRDGGAEMKRLGDNAASLGGIMSANTVASLSRLSLALDDAGTAVRGIGYRISGELAPAITMMVEGFSNAMREGGFLRTAIDGLISNIDTLAASAAVLTGFLGAKLVVAMAVSAGATSVLTGAMILLKKAIFATGFGALVVGAGFLVAKFGDLVQATGSFGAALGLLKDVGVEVWDRIKLGFTGLQFQMQAGWLRIRASAIEAFAGVTQSTLDAVNKIIGGFAGSYQAVVAVWDALPAAFKRIGALAINGLIDAMSAGLTGIVGVLNSVLSIAGIEIDAPDLSNWKVEVGAAADVAGNAKAAFDAAFNTKYVDSSGIAEGMRATAADMSAAGDMAAMTADAFKNAAVAPLASIGALSDAVSGTTDELAQTNDAASTLNDTLSDTGGSSGAAGKAAKALEKAKTETEAFNDALKDAVKTAEELGTEKANILIGGVDSVANAFGDFIAGGLRNFKDFAKSILSSFTSMISQMVAQAARPILFSAMGITGGATGAIAGQPAAGGGGILSSLTSGGGLLGNIASQGIFGTTGIFGSIGSSIGTSIGGILGGANSAIATSLGSLGATIGSIVPIIGIAAAAFSFFKKKTEVLAAGIRVTITDLDAVIQSFETVKTTRFWGLSKKVRTSLTDMEERAAEPFIAAIDSVVAGIEGATANLGLSSEKLANFDYTFDVDTRGKSQEEVQKLLEQEMTGFADAAANALVGTFTEVLYDQDLINKLQQEVQQQSDRTPYGGGTKGAELAAARAGTVVEHFSEVGELFEELRKVGEGTSDTLQRLSNSLTASNAAFDTLGHALFDNSVQGAGYAASLLDMFGGMEAFATATTSYYNTFYSEAERMAVLTRRVTDEFSSLNLTMPDTRAAFRALVEAQDLTTEAGREAYASLISMSGSIAELIPEITEVTDATGNLVEVVEALTEAERQRETLLREFYTLTGDTNALRAMELAALDESNHALQRRIWKIEDEAAALAKLEGAVSAAMRGVSDSIANEIANINSKTDARLALLGANLDRKRANQDRARNYIQDYIDQITTDTVDRFRAMRDAVRAALESRGPVSVDAQRQSYFSASANLQSFAQSGNYSQDQLSGALSGIDVDSAQFFGKQADYAFEYAKTNGALRTIDGQTTRELTDAEKTVEALEKLLEIEEEGFDTLDQAIKTLERATAKEESILKQMEALEFWRESQILNLEAQLTQAQMQTNAILMVDASVKSVGAAITGLGAAIGNLATAQRAAAEAQARIPQAPAANTARAPSSMSESAPMVEELRAMRAELSQIKELNRSTAISAAKSEKLQKKWDIDGNPETRTA